MNERDTSIDLLRGLAIFTMIAANMAAHSLEEPHALYVRIYGSLAAPLFIFLSGMMVSYTISVKGHPLSYYLKRGGLTLFIAALMDVFLWGTVPFTTFDVLYVIGLAMPTIYFFNRLNRILQLLFIALIFGTTPFLQYQFGYAAYPTELAVSDVTGLAEFQAVPILKQLLVDGWFPLFPWMGVAFLGAFIGSLRLKISVERFTKMLLGAGLTSMIIGIGLWFYFNPEMVVNTGFIETPHSNNLYQILLSREGYSELFYPPTLYYLLTFLGFILISVPVMKRFQGLGILQPLQVFGRSSLLVYILHTAFIVFIFNQLNTYSLTQFVLLYLAHASVLWLICFGVQSFKKGKKFPFIVNFIFGG